ncbi:ligase-associated DNA damage response exonuclease [Azoarcus indigens]|uniref:Putative mRNA 3-end processing factor n=1 Tax=Azoarcus indigens TaxID=29545 RepID=A0A4V3BMS2_9RHOO|nr:ligase-associated DNA damage response exonuclease [Azoarcus indigens]NMG65493.1 ligase-associated DNA damage response exonuclease [Azoarcus indigens]TDN51372.1 putative mRNA 3-end processing factor [Azoarcus indigens]
MDLVVPRPEGLYCPPGDFYIDPWRPVARAVITHGHGDHARPGHRHYLAAAAGAGILRARLGDIPLETLPYGRSLRHRGVDISFHPAGHVLGSAQVRLAYGGEVWVASGDYKLEADGTCAPFEPVRCDAFITESTFGLPIYRWPPQAELAAQINAWWAANAAAGRTSVLFCYAFGKAQRILHMLDAAIGPIVVHGALEALNAAYRDAGVALPATLRVNDVGEAAALRQAMVLASPSAQGSPWLRRFGDYADAFASGWMRIRGTRRRRGVDRGFVLSDHADWPGLLAAIAATGAGRVFVTHGSVPVLVRWLAEQGLQAQAFDTEYGEGAQAEEAAGSETEEGVAPQVDVADAEPATPPAKPGGEPAQ